MSDGKYFDLHITGIGYVNRIREVSLRKGQPFLACDIVALHGSTDDPEKTRFDCRVSGRDAQILVAGMQAHLAEDRKVLVNFKLGDLYAETFTYQRGEKAGQTGVSLKARLLRLAWIRVDGDTVYTAASPSESSDPAVEDDCTSGFAADATEQAVDPVQQHEVSLSKDDPDFHDKKAALKAQGYRFNPETKTWRVAS